MSGAYVDRSRSTPRPVLKCKLVGDTWSHRLSIPVGAYQNGYDFSKIERIQSYRTGSSLTEAEAFSGDAQAFTSVTQSGFKPTSETDTGHDFTLTRYRQDVVRAPECFINFGGYGAVRSPIGIKIHKMSSEALDHHGIPSPTPLQVNEDEMRLAGTSAINATNPLASNATLVTTLLETLKEGLPAMVGIETWKSSLRDIRGSSGSEYLNYQFGVVPLVADIVASVKSLRDATKIVTQLQRDNGKNVRRRFNFRPTRSTDSWTTTEPVGVDSISSATGILDPGIYFGRSSFEESRTTWHWNHTQETKLWFSGCFSYFLPSDSGLLSKLSAYEAKANVLLGTRVTPETLWNLTPWSWLLDWKLSLGTIIGNASAFHSKDNLVLRYGYIMRHQSSKLLVQPEPLRVKQAYGGHIVQPMSLLLTSESKARRGATPYGFGVDMSNLSAYQYSILSALGLTWRKKT